MRTDRASTALSTRMTGRLPSAVAASPACAGCSAASAAVLAVREIVQYADSLHAGPEPLKVAGVDSGRLAAATTSVRRREPRPAYPSRRSPRLYQRAAVAGQVARHLPARGPRSRSSPQGGDGRGHQHGRGDGALLQLGQALAAPSSRWRSSAPCRRRPADAAGGGARHHRGRGQRQQAAQDGHRGAAQRRGVLPGIAAGSAVIDEAFATTIPPSVRR